MNQQKLLYMWYVLDTMGDAGMRWQWKPNSLFSYGGDILAWETVILQILATQKQSYVRGSGMSEGA